MSWKLGVRYPSPKRGVPVPLVPVNYAYGQVLIFITKGVDQVDRYTESVAHDQSDVRPTVTFPGA